MSNKKNSEDIYNVSKYTDTELYDILDLSNPSDRELEARIFHLIKKYKTMDSESGNKLALFFEEIYNRFFEIEEENDEKEKHQPFKEEITTNNTNDDNNITNTLSSQIDQPQNLSSNVVNLLEFKKDYLNPLLMES